MTWPAVLVLAAGTYGIRLTGLLLRERLRVGDRFARHLDLGATALLVALVATNTVALDGSSGWARPAGVLVAAVTAWRRVPFVLVVVLAAVTTAGLRLAGLP